MLSTILVVAPWVLTVTVLLVIMFRNMQFEEEDFDLEDEEDYDEQDSQTITVAVYNDKAYWVHENVFYESDTMKEPDFTTARPVDTMDLPPKKLNELLGILDELKEYRKE